MTHSVKVVNRYEVRFDGSKEDYVEFAWRVSANKLDAYDAGDATGFFIEEWHRRQDLAESGVPDTGFDLDSRALVLRSPSRLGQWEDLNILVTVTWDQDLFGWDGEDPTPMPNLTREQVIDALREKDEN